jgi:hypothetical protein
MAKRLSDLEKSRLNGAKEIQNDWVVIDNELTFVGDENAKEEVGYEADTGSLLQKKTKKRNKNEKKKSKKLAKDSPPTASLWSATNIKNLAVSWIRKALGGRGIGKMLSAEDTTYRATYRKVW